VADWIKVGAVLVEKKRRLVAEVTGFTESGNPVIEYDDDGSIHDYFTMDEVAEDFVSWREGMEVADRTGKGRFANPEAWSGLGRPPPEK
jgi:hypothetical protein